MADRPQWLQVVGWSATGKTTLLTAVIRLAVAEGAQVAAVKWSHHPLAPSTPKPLAATDTGRLAAAGAGLVYRIAPDGYEVLVQCGASRVVAQPASLADYLRMWRQLEVDWLVVEGGRTLPTPKIVLAPGREPEVSDPVVLWVGKSSAAAGVLQLTDTAPPGQLARWIWARRGWLARSVPDGLL